MFVCPFKKVTIQKNSVITCISCNNQTNTLAIGGDNGFLKVVQIDLSKQRKNPDGTAASPLTFSQTLTAHKSKVIIVTWNDSYDKLTSCDEEGVIVVWRLSENDTWETEMINNREVSHVTDLKWSSMGNFLCFIYDDGHAIVGTVEGSRSWGNDIKQGLYKVEWSPDESFILFCVQYQNIIIFSCSGYQIGEMEIPVHLRPIKVSEIAWWTNPLVENKTITDDRHLVLVFETGVILLFNSHQDLKPVEFKTNFISILKAQWSPNGEILSIAGKIKEDEVIKDCVNFYSHSGKFLQDLKIPNRITSLCWESYGTKVAITTDTFILFCLVKPNYKWTFFSGTLVYSYMTDAEHHTIVFWDMSKNTKNFKFVKNLMGICSCNSFCLLTAKVSDNKYIAILCNSIGSPVDNRIINIRPDFISMNDTHAVISSTDFIYLWQFRYQKVDLSQYYGNKLNTDLLNRSVMKEIAFFIEDTPNIKDNYSAESFLHKKTTNDPICAIFCNDKFLIVTCESGRGFLYDLPLISTPERLFLGTKVVRVGLSPDGNYAWGIDDLHYLSIWDLTKTTNSISNSSLKGLKKSDFEKNDVWTVIWSSDDSNSFAFTQKNILNIYKNFECEEVLNCNGYLAEFNELKINTIMLEDVLIRPSSEHLLEVKDISIVFETRILRDLREMMANNINLDDIYKYVEKHNHDKLWTLLTEHAMLKLEFGIAEKCLIRKQDFIGLSLLKRIKTIEEDDFKKAEIHQHFFDYDKAEDIYRKKERKDLLINMRIKLGHWEKVISLIEESSVIQEDNLKVALNNLATQFIEKKQYDKAEELLLKTGNREELINVWFLTEKFQKAGEYIHNIPEGSEFLLFMGEKFELYGLTEEAVNCFMRYGDIKRAIDICVLTNQWNLAVELAEKNNLFQVEGLVNKFSTLLIEKNKKMELVEFYRKAHKHTESAKILIKIAEELRALNTSPYILKKIYVLAALEMESFKTRYVDAQITSTITTNNIGGQTTNKTLDTLITSDLSNLGDKALNNPWKGAEAFHYYMLCQNQMYNK
jgi:WD repeat-containing protein 35